jgi:hypothetical protein
MVGLDRGSHLLHDIDWDGEGSRIRDPARERVRSPFSVPVGQVRGFGVREFLEDEVHPDSYSLRG